MYLREGPLSKKVGEKTSLLYRLVVYKVIKAKKHPNQVNWQWPNKLNKTRADVYTYKQ